MNAQQLQDGLAHFYGTENYFYNPLYRKLKYTDGVQFFALNAGNGALWFLDIIGTEVHPLAKKKGEEFTHVKLKSAGGKADITADDGNGNIFWQRHIEYTDCPEGEWGFYLTDDVLLLPSEY